MSDARPMLLLFLAAREGAADALSDALHAERSRLAEHAQTAVFTRLVDDPFAAFNPGMRGFEATIEFAAAPQVQAAAAVGLGGRLDPFIQRDLSAALVGDEHTFVSAGPSPVRYQYLMRRRRDFDPTRYLDHYRTVHSGFGVRTGGQQGYSQFHTDLDASQRAARALGFGVWRIDSVSRLWIESPDHFLANAGDAGQEAVEDEEGFVDRANSVMFASEPLRA